VGKQSALRHVHRVGQRPDGHSSKPHLASRPRRLVQHSVPGQLALAHEALIARSFVRCKTLQNTSAKRTVIRRAGDEIDFLSWLEAGDALSDHRNADYEKQDGHDRGVVVDQPSTQLVQGPRHPR
jgi:hypothetical protein